MVRNTQQPEQHMDSQQGAVLIVVLAMVTVLSITAIQLARVAARNTVTASRIQDKEHAERIADSVIATGLYILSKDDTKVDTLHETWNQFDLAMHSMQQQMEGVKVFARIQDASGLFNLNSLGTITTEQDIDAATFLRMLKQAFPSMSNEHRNDLLWRLKDWVDTDTVEARWGRVEEEAYHNKDGVMQPLNRPFKSMAEVEYAMRGTPLLPVVASEQFASFFAVHLRTKVNINTATKVYLSSLFADEDISKQFAEDVLEYRKDEDAELGGTWFTALRDGEYAKYFASGFAGVATDIFFIDVLVEASGVIVSRRAYVERTGSVAQIQFMQRLPQGVRVAVKQSGKSQKKLMEQSMEQGMGRGKFMLNTQREG